MVQFEKILQQQIITKWDSFYLDYKGLKRLIKKLKHADEKAAKRAMRLSAGHTTPLLSPAISRVKGEGRTGRKKLKDGQCMS